MVGATGIEPNMNEVPPIEKQTVERVYRLNTTFFDQLEE